MVKYSKSWLKSLKKISSDKENKPAASFASKELIVTSEHHVQVALDKAELVQLLTGLRGWEAYGHGDQAQKPALINSITEQSALVPVTMTNSGQVSRRLVASKS